MQSSSVQSKHAAAAVTIVRNILQYSQILNQAASQQITKWDAISVHNAVRWALYCEEIHKHASGQEYEVSLNSQLKQLTLLLRPVSCLQFTVSSLQNATKLLTEALLANPHSTPFVKGTLERCLKTVKGCNKDFWKETKEKLKSSESLIQVLQDVFSLKSTSEQKADLVLRHLSLKCNAELLIQSFTEISKCTSDEKRLETYCYSLCERIFTEFARWDLLIYCVSLDPNTQSFDDGLILKQISDYILSWMITKLENSSEVCPIWEINPLLLKDAFANNAIEFVKFYFLALDKWADSFQPSLDCLWRTPSGHTAKDLTDHVKELLFTQDSSGASYLLDILNERVNNSDFTVWQTVVVDILNTN